jgi:hypothetical protein
VRVEDVVATASAVGDRNADPVHVAHLRPVRRTLHAVHGADTEHPIAMRRTRDRIRLRVAGAPQ